MRSREFIVEYDRSRAAQAIPNLWRAALREKLDYWALPLANFEKKFEELYPAAFRIYKHILTNPDMHKQLAEDALRQLEQVDPTTNKKYTQWLGRMFASDPATKLEDILSTTAEYLHKFNILSRKKLLKSEHADINRYKSLKVFMDAMDQYELPEDDTNKGTATKAYSDSDVTVVIPEDEAAACSYGRQTRWCTASTKGINYFDHYHTQGTLYILLPKSPEHNGEKYQLHFASQQFMNEHDEQVNLVWLLTDRFPGLEKFFRQHEGQELGKLIVFAPNQVLKPLLDAIAEIMMEQVNEIIGEAEINDEGYWSWLQRGGYVDADGDIDWERAPPYFDYNPDAKSEYNAMRDSVTLSPDELKQATDDFMQANPDHEQPAVSDIETVLYHYIYENAPDGLSGALRRYLNDHVVITLGRSGDYSVKKV